MWSKWIEHHVQNRRYGEVGRGQTREGLRCHLKKSGFYLLGNKESLKGLSKGVKLPNFPFFKKLINLFIIIIFWLCWVFVSVRGLSLAAASGGHSSSRCAGLSLSQPLLLWSTGSRRAGSVVVAHGPSCSTACGILPDQGSNLCPLHWQADSQPLRHQGSPKFSFLINHSDSASTVRVCDLAK